MATISNLRQIFPFFALALWLFPSCSSALAGCPLPSDLDIHTATNFSCGALTLAGGVCEFQCQFNYKLIGSGVYTCSPDGTWKKSGYQCVPMACKDGVSTGVCTCYAPQWVECIEVNLTSFPVGLSPLLEAFALDSIQIPTLTTADLAPFTKLKNLDITNLPLSTLPSTIFRQLNNTLAILGLGLREDLLSYFAGKTLVSNSLEFLPHDIFHGLSKLQSLDLHLQVRLSPHPLLFRTLTALKSLTLTGVSFSQEFMMSDPFQDLFSLEFLDLVYCGIKSIPPGFFAAMRNLKRLDLSYNVPLVEVHPGAFSFHPNLTSLRMFGCLSNCYVVRNNTTPYDPLSSPTVACTCAGGYSGSGTFCVKNCDSMPFTPSTTCGTTFAGGPACTASCGSDAYDTFVCNTTGNWIQSSSCAPTCASVPNCNCSMSSVSCSDGTLRTIPSAIPSSVTSLEIIGNLLTTIPLGTLDHLINLTSLRFELTPLVSIPAGAFRYLTRLQSLAFERCPLNSLPVNLLFFNTLLSEIKFHSSNLTVLPPSLFYNLPYLYTLSLNRGPLAELGSNVFYFNQNLKSLNLFSNLLEEIDSQMFFPIPQLTDLDLSQNLIVFTCETLQYLPNLQRLSVARPDTKTAIRDLPDCVFQNNRRLQKLSFQLVNFRLIPASVQNLTSLSELDLSGNPKLRLIPQGFFSSLPSLTSLQMFPLENASFCTWNSASKKSSCSCGLGYSGDGTYCVPDCGLLDQGLPQGAVMASTCNTTRVGSSCLFDCGHGPPTPTFFECDADGVWQGTLFCGAIACNTSDSVGLCSCLSRSSMVVACSALGLTEFIHPYSIPSNTSTVKLDGNNLAMLPDPIYFQPWSSLLSLDLSSNLIETIPSFSFKYLSSLQHLDLRNNLISFIEPRAFDGLFNLYTIGLSNNLLTQIPVISAPYFLVSVDLSFNNLTAISEPLVYPYLVTLNLANNNIQTITVDAFPSGIGAIDMSLNPSQCTAAPVFLGISIIRCKCDTGLYSYRNSSCLRECPAHPVFPLSLGYQASSCGEDNHFENNATCLVSCGSGYFYNSSLFRCSSEGTWQGDLICEVKSCVGECECTTSSEGLSLACIGSGYNSIPSDIPTHVVSLSLQSNALSSLVSLHDISFPYLKSLDLSFNLLSSIPAASFASIPSLTTLNLDRNALLSLKQSTFANLTLLKTLKLNYCKLTFVENGAFNDLPLLETLELTVNLITLLGGGVFDGLSSLQTLALNVNGKIQFESLSPFSSLSQLRSLKLPACGLKDFNSSMTEGMPNLVTLDLTGNYLTRLHASWFSSLPHLETLLLAYNSIEIIDHGGLDSQVIPNLVLSGNPSICTYNTTAKTLDCSCSASMYTGGSFCEPFCAGSLPSTSAHAVGRCSSTQPYSNCSVGCYESGQITHVCMVGVWQPLTSICVQDTSKSDTSSGGGGGGGASIIALVVTVVVVLLAALIFVVWYLRRRRRITLETAALQSRIEAVEELRARVQRMLFTEFSTLGSRTESDSKRNIGGLEITRARIVLDRTLGSGAFGEVRLGKLLPRHHSRPAKNQSNRSSSRLATRNPIFPTASLEMEDLSEEAGHNNKSKEVAVKVLNVENNDFESQCRFLLEAQLMALLHHPNITSIIGVCTQDFPPLIVLEYLPGGNLRDYLRNKTHAALIQPNPILRPDSISSSHIISTADIIMVSLQIASAMLYLESNRIVHRDVAARNVLVGSGIDNVKLADFGMSRFIKENSVYYRKKSEDPVPVRWMPPEAIRDKVFSTASDVWSYGVLLWEIASMGKSPYGILPTVDIINSIINGVRLTRPPNCDPDLYEVMLGCWALLPPHRPSFNDIYTKLETIKFRNLPEAVNASPYSNSNNNQPSNNNGSSNVKHVVTKVHMANKLDASIDDERNSKIGNPRLNKPSYLDYDDEEESML